MTTVGPVGRVLYITGGGKCGTHVAAAFIHANWLGSTLHPVEFKTWPDELPRYFCDKFIFHRPRPLISRFRELCPTGRVLVLLRSPAQQYMAWLCTLAQDIVRPWKHNSTGENDIHVTSMNHVLSGFVATPDADDAWQLEEFSANPTQRLAMVSRILDGDSIGHDAPVTVKKSRFGWRDGIHPLQGNEYPAILTDAEIAAFDRPDINAAYPHWADRLLMLDRSDEERVRQRFRVIVTAARTRLLDRWSRNGSWKKWHLLASIEPTQAAERAADDYLASARSARVLS